MSLPGTASRATLSGAAASNLLIGLPEGTPQIKYTNMKKLNGVISSRARECCIDNSKSPFLIVTFIPSTFLIELDQFYHSKTPRLTAYIQEKIAIVEVMVTTPHELISRALSSHIWDSVNRRGLRKILHNTGAARMTSTTGNSAKEADGSFMLASEKWPSITIETGLSEHITKLAIDAQWWLEVEGSRTLVVITAKIDRQKPRIVFQRWEHHHPAFRPITRHYHPVSMVMQEVHAVHEGGITRVTGDLIIPFEKMFRRPVDGGKEKDIVIGQEMLAEAAESAWEYQCFM